MVDHSTIKVLVIDDEQAIRESLSEFLADFDYEVFAARDGEGALAILRQEDCQVAIVDLRLPGMSSEETIREARALAPDIRFLIHTGSVDFTPPPSFLELGILPRHVIRKPSLRLTAFVEAIDDLVGGSADAAPD
jgi:DNA-binding NtrC family response regulator